MKGKTIRIYLADGVPTGILTAEIINWTGKVAVCPRSQLAELAKRGEVRRTGIYFLVGSDPDGSNRDCVYIGEADNVLSRLASHDKDESKDFWTRTALVISKDENLTKSHGRYLESRLIDLTRQAGRAILANNTAPDTPPLPEPDAADMEYFIEQVQMILPVLGLGFLQPKPKPAVAAGSPRFVLTQVGVHATAEEVTEGEMFVHKGSTARREGVPSWRSYRSLREHWVAEGVLADSDDPDYLVFTEDVVFSSPSAAASVVLGRASNGRIEWRVETTGQTYQEWHERRLKKVVGDDIADTGDLSEGQ